MVDSGDLLFRKYLPPLLEGELKSFSEKALLIIESLNLMGYDAMGVGDDDLSLGKEFLLKISKKANFPILSANIVDEESGKPLFQTSLVKESNGLRIGLFSLLSPDLFSSLGDSRLKGISIRPPFETAQAMVRELQPKTDLIVLLSHLSYQKDLELAQAVPGIHLIVGSHTGLNLTYPPVVKNTVILQLGGKGMYGGRFELTLHDPNQSFYNLHIKRSLENNLRNINARLNSRQLSETEKVQLRRMKEDAERRLQEFRDKNEFTNQLVILNDQMKEHPEVAKMIAAYKAKFPEAAKPSLEFDKASTPK